MNILILGANSAIATATARRYAEQGHDFFLVARDAERLGKLATDLQVRGAGSVSYEVLDFLALDQHPEVMVKVTEKLAPIDLVLVCHGTLPDRDQSEENFEYAQQQITVNATSVISLVTCLLPVLKGQRRGVLAVVTSVAGDRGRQPNYLYGAAKSMVSTYLQGLRGRLLEYNVHVMDIRPGLVDSPMTAQFEKGPLWSTPELVADKIVTAVHKRRHTVYVPGYWRIIMAVVRSIPDFLFKRLKF
ncbi:MAG: SDR family oxidoreductase [Pseudohongiellaceae bacterium]|jgi:hypothetical protein